MENVKISTFSSQDRHTNKRMNDNKGFLKDSYLTGSWSNIVHFGELTAAKTAPFSFRLALNFLSSSTVSWRCIFGANLSLSLTHLWLSASSTVSLSSGLTVSICLTKSLAWSLIYCHLWKVDRLINLKIIYGTNLAVFRYSFPSQMVSYNLSLVPRNGSVPLSRMCSSTPVDQTSTGLP